MEHMKTVRDCQPWSTPDHYQSFYLSHIVRTELFVYMCMRVCVLHVSVLLDLNSSLVNKFMEIGC